MEFELGSFEWVTDLDSKHESNRKCGGCGLHCFEYYHVIKGEDKVSICPSCVLKHEGLED